MYECLYWVRIFLISMHFYKNPSTTQQEINYLYPITGVEQKRRSDLTKDQTGTNKIRDPDRIYWLFKLGTALKLKSPVIKTAIRRFEVKLTSAAALSNVNNWSDLPQRYQILVDQ